MTDSLSHAFARLLYLPALLLLGAASPEADAAPFPQTEQEFARLPPYCAARMKKAEDPATYKLWESRLTMNCFLHIHHYCAALNSVEHAMMAKTKKERDQYLLDSMTGGFDYMWNQAGASCPIMPEILVSKGKALIMLDKEPEAAASFQKAMQLNPRFVPAYVALADLYKKAGQTETARQLLDYALKIDPGNRALNRRLAEFDTRGQSGDAQSARRKARD